MELASVCHKFRSAAFCCPIPVRLPLSDQRLQLMRTYKIPIKSLCNVQPSMYVAYQLASLNLNRLTEAQLVANDYMSKSKKTILSPQYWTLLRHIYPCYILKGTNYFNVGWDQVVSYFYKVRNMYSNMIWINMGLCKKSKKHWCVRLDTKSTRVIFGVLFSFFEKISTYFGTRSGQITDEELFN